MVYIARDFFFPLLYGPEVPQTRYNKDESYGKFINFLFHFCTTKIFKINCCLTQKKLAILFKEFFLLISILSKLNKTENKKFRNQFGI
jgi:hypothetical protein